MATITLSREGGVAVVTVSNPPLNLFTADSWSELIDCVAEVEGSDARALVWRAEGELFTGGVDVANFQAVVDAGPERASGFAQPLIDGVRRLEALEIPTLAIVHGLCLTAGLEISLGCDIIWASESARFGLVEMRRKPARRRCAALCACRTVPLSLLQPLCRLFDDAQIGFALDVKRRLNEAEVARHIDVSL